MKNPLLFKHKFQPIIIIEKIKTQKPTQNLQEEEEIGKNHTPFSK